MQARKVIAVAWPAYLAACALEFVVFAAVDPRELEALTQAWALPRQAVYSIAFFLFWAIAAACGALTAMLWNERPRELEPPP